MGASERNPTWGEMFMAHGRAKARIVELEAEVARYRGDLLNLPGLVSEFARDKPRELVEVMEAAGVIEPAGEPGSWRLVLRGRLVSPHFEIAKDGATRQLLPVEDDDDVVDGEIVE
jgi:hypothetical protein